MPLSLGSARGGYGMGVRPLRPVIVSARTKPHLNNGIMHPSVPNGDFVTSSTTISVNGADGNQSGTANATALIDGASQVVLTNCKVITPGDGYCWTFVKNAAGEVRLVRAAYNGSITTPGVKFSPTVAGSFTDESFCYESGGNIIVRSYNSNSLYEFTISKATGAVTNQVVLVTSTSSKSQGTYITADGRITFSKLRKINSGDEYCYINICSFDGSILPVFLLSDAEVFGGIVVSNAAAFYPIVAGDYLQFSTNTGQLDFRIFKRAEFDRWLLDIAKKFELV